MGADAHRFATLPAAALLGAWPHSGALAGAGAVRRIGRLSRTKVVAMPAAPPTSPVQLDPATAEFITGVTSMSIASRDAQLLPAAGIALGVVVGIHATRRAERVGHEAAQCLVNRCIKIHAYLFHLPFLEWCAVFRNFPVAADRGTPMEGIVGIRAGPRS